MTTTEETAVDDTASTEETPPPGSEAARAAGCTCPAWINTFGAGVRTGCGTPPEADTYLAHPACCLHGSL